jgi:hypothetical protein
MTLLDHLGNETATKKSLVTPKVVIENNNVQSLAFNVALEMVDGRPVVTVQVYNRIEMNKKSELKLVMPNQRLLIDESE